MDRSVVLIINFFQYFIVYFIRLLNVPLWLVLFSFMC